MKTQRVQCHAVVAGEIAAPQTARLVHTSHSRNLRATPTMNEHSMLSARDNC